MSKSKKKRKKNVNQNIKQKKSYKKLIIGTVISVLVVTAIVVLIVLFSRNPNAELTEKTWYSVDAYNSSDEQVELAEIYSNYYTTYQGRLTFENDGTFEIWLTVGDREDGTHIGTYTYDGEIIKVKYNLGAEAEFKVSKDENGKILNIIAPYTNDYDTYSVYFN